MSTRQDVAPSEIIGSRDDLIAWIAAGEKPREAWRIGTEHEKFVFHGDTRAPVAHEGPHGISALMSGFMECCGWEPITEGDNLIALKRRPGEPGATVSLEPGGQFELSGAPLRTVHETAAETEEHLRQCHRAGGPLGLGFLGLGFAPTWTLDEVPHVPKRRYGIMTRYMPKVGTRGLDMMYRTATIQANVDFGSEADMVKKLRVALSWQPVATALFASSPFTEGRPNGFKSMRSEIWRHTDPHRTGMLPFAFDDGMGYEAFVDYALQVPMYFVYREGNYIDVAGASFKDFMTGKLPGLEGERPTLDDWSDHLTTLFPEVRLKRFLEMRGADGGRAEMINALPALWAGILYEPDVLDAAWQRVKDWTPEERQKLRDDVPRLALETPFRSGHVADLAREMVSLAAQGLAKRNFLDAAGSDERQYLAPLAEIVERRQTVADQLLEKYHGSWGGDIAWAFAETAM